MNKIEWSVASKPFPGQTESGDLHLVTPRLRGTLVAAIDGLGHGPEAAQAAKLAAAMLAGFSDEDVVQLLRRCDLALKQTRGAVISVAAVDDGENSLTWSGIGNVSGIVCHAEPRGGRARRRLAPRPGVIGSGTAQPTSERVDFYPGDVLVFATDGIASAFVDCIDAAPSESLQEVAKRILDDHWQGRDDGLVLVARSTGD